MVDGLLAKLTILPFSDPETVQAGPPAATPFIAQFNPESFSVSTNLKVGQSEQAQGDQAGEAKFESVEPRTFSFEFLLDGTGADGSKTDVLAQLLAFKATTADMNGESHRPYFLLIQWGAFLATCVLQSYTVNYQLFRSDGTPLRATLAAQFLEHTPNTLKQLIMNKASPDVAHAHDVIAGEHLALLTHRIYDDAAHYVDVARANGLDTLRRVETGTTLSFPVLD